MYVCMRVTHVTACLHGLCWLLSGGEGGLFLSFVTCLLVSVPDQNTSAESGKRKLHSPAKEFSSTPQAKRKTFNALGLLPDSNTGKEKTVNGLKC